MQQSGVQESAATWATASFQCPKHMAHGPCAGLDSQGTCEVAGFGRCSFLDLPVAAWPYRSVPPGVRTKISALSTNAFVDAAARRPVVVVDLPSAPLSATSERRAAAALSGSVDACLLGDHPAARVQFPPSYRARLLADEGAPAWVGINCRDRNRVAIEGEIAACVDAGALGVHCITGAHPSAGHRPEAAAVFDVDCIDAVLLARAAGALCSVAHAPAAPPRAQRLPRLLAKVDAGAQVVFVDHCGGPGPVGEAVAALRETGFGGLVVVCVPVITDPETARLIASFAGDRFPPGYAESILGAPDPELAGMEAATALSMQMLEIGGVDGVDLGVAPPPGQELEIARRLSVIARRVLGRDRSG